MNKRMIMLMGAALALLSASGQMVNFIQPEGLPDPIDITLSNNQTSLNKIFVLYSTDGVAMTYTASSSEPVRWYLYDQNTWSAPEEIIVSHSGMVTTLNKVEPNKGYIIMEGLTPHYYWVVNYADYELSINDIFADNENPCAPPTLRVDGQGKTIYYSEIDGETNVLDREITLSYKTKEWNDSTWEDKTIVQSYKSLNNVINLEQPVLWNTTFVLSGDRFLREWKIEEECKECAFNTQAVGCGSTYEQEDRGNDNEKGIKGGLGGSAPVHIIFTGMPTDAAVYRKWEMATDQDFEDIVLQYINQEEVDYTFNDYGTYYMRYMVANADGSCEAYCDPYTISVSISSLECPNAFSPGSTPKVNDIWKVSYESIVEFHCWIFNRWGTLVYEYTDPGGGWDGYYKGKLVDTGVYYYVITALGSDGVKYKKRGDITVLRYKGSNAGATTPTDSGF